MAKKTKDSSLSIVERLEQALIPNWDEPYKLPTNWCWVNLGSLGTLGMGQTILSKDLKEEGIPVYSATEEDKIFGYISESENTIKLSSGDIVIPARGNSIGHVKYISCDEASCTQTTIFFKPFDKSIGKCVYYYMQGNKHKLFAYHGNAIPQITITSITKKEIPIPPLNEQQRIVERIESLFAKLDEAKEKVQEVVDGFETRKAAILHKAFSGELTAKWREEYHRSIHEWSNWSIDELCFSLKYGTAKKSKSEGSVVVIRMGNLQQGEIDWTDLAYTDDPEDIEKYRLYPGDVLFNRTNSAVLVGKTSIYRGEYPAIFAGYLIKLDYDRNIIVGDYLNYAMNTIVAKEYCNSVKTDGVNQSNINAKKIGAFVIPVAPKSEQEEIVRIINGLLSKEQAAKDVAESVIEQIDAMKKAILARAFRGELGTNAPTEESAVELLKQVLNTASEQRKTTVKRAVIPKSLKNRIKTDLERKIIKLYFQNKVDVLTIDLIMSVSSKKFDIMEALRDLQQRGILEKENNKYKLLG